MAYQSITQTSVCMDSMYYAGTIQIHLQAAHSSYNTIPNILIIEMEINEVEMCSAERNLT